MAAPGRPTAAAAGGRTIVLRYHYNNIIWLATAFLLDLGFTKVFPFVRIRIFELFKRKKMLLRLYGLLMK